MKHSLTKSSLYFEYVHLYNNAMKKSVFIYAAFALLLGFSACSTSGTPEPKTGDTWVYHYVDYNEDGSIAAEQNLTFTATEFIQNDVYWAFLSAGSGFDIGYFRMDDNGLHQLSNGIDQLKLPYPGAVGDSAITYDSNQDMLWFIIRDNAASINTPAGTFTAYYYEGYDDNSLEDKLWFTPTHWFLRHEEYDQNLSGNYIDYMFEIVSYTEG